MIQSRKVKIHLNQSQKALVAKNFGAKRFIWNWGLEQLNNWWEENKVLDKAKRSKRPSVFDLNNKLNKLKNTDEFSWLKKCDSRVQLFALNSLNESFKRFWKRESKYPKFKSKKCSRQSYTSSSPSVPNLIDNNHLRLAKLGKVKFYNKGYIPNVKLKQATISYDGINYYCSVLIDESVVDWGKGEGEIGIDLGVKTSITCSNGQVYSWKTDKRLERRIKLSQRALSRTQKSSKRRIKSRLRLSRRYKRFTNQHKDFLHKTTSKLVRENQAIRMEDLNVKGMIRNHFLSKSIQSQSFAELKRQLDYKCCWHEREFQLIDRFYPSSQLCSKCGAKNRGMKNLAKRIFICPVCGITLDRDMNAAINILNFPGGEFATTAGSAGSYARGDWKLFNPALQDRVASRGSENCRKTLFYRG